MNDGRSGPRVALATGALRLTAVSEVGELAPHIDDWRALLESTPGSCAYQAPEWVLRWFAHAGVRDRLHVVLVHRGDRLVGVAPFTRAALGIGPARVEALITAATEPGDYGDPLLAPDEADEVAVLLLDHLVAWARSMRTVVSLRRLDDQGPLHRAAIGGHGLRAVETSRTVAPCTRFAEWDDPAAEIDKRARSLKLPKLRRRLEKDHGPAELVTRNPAGWALDRMACMHVERFGADDAPRLLQLARSRALVVDAVDALDRVGLARMCQLRAGEEVVALELGHVVRTRWVGQAAGFDPEMGRFRPGHLLVHAILEHALAQGVAEYDHGQGAHPYKAHWATGERCLRSVVLVHRGAAGQVQLLVQRAIASRRARTLLSGPVGRTGRGRPESYRSGQRLTIGS